MDFWGKNNNTQSGTPSTAPASPNSSSQAQTQTSAPPVDVPKKPEEPAKEKWDLPKTEISPTGMPDTSSFENPDFSYSKKESLDDDLTVDPVKAAPTSSDLSKPSTPDLSADTGDTKNSVDTSPLAEIKSLEESPSKEPAVIDTANSSSASLSSIDDLEDKIKSQKDELQTKIDKLSAILEKITELKSEEKDVIREAEAIVG